MALPPEQRFRYNRVRVADNTNDQKTPSQIVAGATGGSVTQEDYQEFVLSQIKRIIFGASAGNWYSSFESQDIQPLAEISGAEKIIITTEGHVIHDDDGNLVLKL